MAGQQTRGSRRSEYVDNGGAELDSDRRARRAGARERDEPFERAYKAGQRGDDPAEFQTDDKLWATYQDGAKATRNEGRQQRRDELTGKAGAKAGSVANDGAGFLLGLLAYAVLANFLRGGMPAVRSWFAAKFLNRTTDAGRPRPAVPSTPARPTSPAVAFRNGSSSS